MLHSLDPVETIREMCPLDPGFTIYNNSLFVK
nr:MAG TPA_asm: hypothetical protein [Caudoviricetes sp.]